MSSDLATAGNMLLTVKSALRLFDKDRDLYPDDELAIIDQGAAGMLLEVATGMAKELTSAEEIRTTTALTPIAKQVTDILLTGSREDRFDRLRTLSERADLLDGLFDRNSA